MRDWADIVKAYTALQANGKPAALATVVRVEGSAYRRPGARMLVTEDGQTWGGVSGGCLERDVADRARGVIVSGQPYVYRYDTADDELIARGVSTGCGGTIDVLIQPLLGSCQVIELARQVLKHRQAVTVATIVGTPPHLRHRLGETSQLDQLPQEVRDLASPFIRPQRLSFGSSITEKYDYLVERLMPPQRLVIVGGGPDAVPVLIIAKTLGWHVAVVAARPALSLQARFGDADETYVTGSDQPLQSVPITGDCAMVVMTHNIARDAAVLAALETRPRYLGLLGPRHRAERTIAALPEGHPGRALHSPIGLDIGSESPEEIALSIIAEVQACIRTADARPLHSKPSTHQPDAAWAV